MPRLSLDRIRVDFPNHVSISPWAPGITIADSGVDTSSLISIELDKSSYRIVQAISIEHSSSPSDIKNLAVDSPTECTIRVELDTGENAVILTELDGVYSWSYADTPPFDSAPNQLDVSTTATEAVFTLDLRPDDEEISAAGIIGRLVKAGIVWVLTFAVKRVGGTIVSMLEKERRTALIQINSADPSQWIEVGKRSLLDRGVDKPQQMLLLIHGTFSSTKGSFSTLLADEDGFLHAALRKYDTVLGFDHRTLSEGPKENAEALLAQLQMLTDGLRSEISIDIVCYSRGALVGRILVEELLAAQSSRLNAEIDRVMFIGATNGGTELARAENWPKIIDLYTNLSAAISKVLPQFMGALIIADIIEIAGSLVKNIASFLVSEDGAPGLSAMVPDSDTLRELNSGPPGTSGYVVSSNFEARVELGSWLGITKSVGNWILDLHLDRLIGTENDLVVHTDSMSELDSSIHGFVLGETRLDAVKGVHHLGYFKHPEVHSALKDWLIDRVGSHPPAWPRPGSLPAPPK